MPVRAQEPDDQHDAEDDEHKDERQEQQADEWVSAMELGQQRCRDGD